MNATGHAVPMVSRAGRWSGLIAASSFVWGCAQAPTPMRAPPPPKPVVSYINIPITVPLAYIEKTAEADVPRSYSVEPFQALNGGSAPPACGQDVGYAIERGSISLSGAENVVVTSADLSYWLKGRKQAPCPGTVINASCGTDGEPPRTARVGIDSEIMVLPDLTTAVRSTLKPAVPADRCVMRPVGLDITDSLMIAAPDRSRSPAAIWFTLAYCRRPPFV